MNRVNVSFMIFMPLKYIIALILTSIFLCIFSTNSKAQEKDKNEKTKVKKISFEIEKDTELLIINLDKVTIPNIFDINGKNPRIVIDIMDVLPGTVKYKTPVNGKLIKQIRAYYHKKTGKLRIVLDLYPDTKYVKSRLLISKNILLGIKPYESPN